MRTVISENLIRVTASIEALKQTLDIPYNLRLVAVSKLQPIEAIREAYDLGHRHFGENYVDELVSKAEQLPNDIVWHMIGHLQSNKCKKLLSVTNLDTVETIDSIDLANKLNAQASKVRRLDKLKIFIQVNTSHESTKSGIAPESCPDIALHIIQNCPCLEFRGVMTIGAQGSSQDFLALTEARRHISNSLAIPESSLELSMGMSGDYEEAIQHGSTNVRVGSLIFGERLKH